ncbi:MAG: hypothetical protein M1320_00165 [Patescibacteria group bacterium]|nr:hypothetical protein [Patescibacteria group bacterium]
MGKKNFERQTSLSFDQISKILTIADENDSPYPRCLLANELGVMANNDNSEQAQEKLCELLNAEDECEKVKYISYCWLCNIPITDKTSAALQIFSNDQKNAEIIETAATNNIYFHLN